MAPRWPAPGLYDLLLTQRVEALLAGTLGAQRVPLGASEASRVLARFLADHVARALETVPEDDRPAAQISAVNSVLERLAEVLIDFGTPDDRVSAEVLRAVAPDRPPPERPELPLSESGLYVNARRERRIGIALQKEISSADRVDLLCAFLLWTGYRELRPRLLAHLEAGRRLRVLTTTYRGVTQAGVLEDLLAHNAEVRVSYDTETTRLHAKAWYFHRESGFSTAYIGSSNLSKSAMTAGLEWNVRLSQIENRAVVEEFAATFGSYWEDQAEFQPYHADRFAAAVKHERPRAGARAVFDLRPREFQREILERLAAERALHDRHKNLVVAATGTGKTVIAALDYRDLCNAEKRRPTLLFVAHRREILQQAMDTFQHALSDPDFGEKLVDNQRPADWRHVFASVQSLAFQEVKSWPPDRFDVVIIDEFHHASEENQTYATLLQHLRSKELLGLTATPERTDGVSVLGWFDGRITAELRLWDAIDRGLLVPFQYFAVADPVAIERIHWISRGRLDLKKLDGLYTGHHARAHFVIEAVRKVVEDPLRMRALAFCVGVGHAEFMADAFRKAGLAAESVTTSTSRADRARALAGLRDGTIRVLCAVDVFNEGVDIPEVDTVLFLRPTESALVFVQQLGRGLRRFHGKSCLTVIDFVAAADRQFRYEVRYQPLLETRTGRASLRRQVAEGFPYLPSGCSIEFDRVSRERVLHNLSLGIGSNRRSLLAELEQLGDVSLATFLHETNLLLGDLYRNGRYFSDLRRAARIPCPPEGPDESALGAGVGRLIHVDDRLRLSRWRQLLESPGQPRDTRDERLWLMLATMLFGAEAGSDAVHRLSAHPAIRHELSELFTLLDDQLEHNVLPFNFRDIPLAVHAKYRLSEIMAAFGDVRNGRLYIPREGEYLDEATRCNLLFVTLQKDQDDYSPTTMYKDYAMGPSRFHWQSQSATRPTDKKGVRHISHAAQGVTPLLFVRERKRDDRNDSVPYVFLGPVRLAAWSGERPMNIEWDLEHPLPAEVQRMASLVG